MKREVAGRARMNGTKNKRVFILYRICLRFEV